MNRGDSTRRTVRGLVGLLVATAVGPRAATAQVRLVPFVGTFEPLGGLGSPSAANAQNGVSAGQTHAMAFGIAAGGNLTGMFGVEGAVTLAPSGLGIHVREPTTGGEFTLVQNGWILLASALAVMGRPADGSYGVAGVGVQKRWGTAWQGVAGGDLWSVGGVFGIGTAARLTDRWRLDLRAELRLYGFDPDGGGTDFGSSLATDLLVRVGVPLALGQPRRAGAAAAPAARRVATRDTVAAVAEPPGADLPLGESVVAVAAGGRQTCARTSAGTVRCWGAAGGAPAPRVDAAPSRAGVTTPALAAGREHACALSGRIALCWGSNAAGQLGTDDQRAREHRITGVELTALAAGDEHTCGITADGAVLCWGANDRGQLGDGSTRRRARPAPIAAKGRFTSVAAGGDHTCALRQDGVVLCWGDNWSGQVGSDMIESIPQPTEIAGGRRFVQLAAGARHTCALDARGVAWCWGANAAGQLGDGGRRQRNRASAVSGPARFTVVTAGGDHTCGLTAEGEAWCWGRGRDGELGDGASADRAVPVPARGDSRFAQLALGDRHSCGLTTDGRLLCWGDSRGAR